MGALSVLSIIPESHARPGCAHPDIVEHDRGVSARANSPVTVGKPRDDHRQYADRRLPTVSTSRSISSSTDQFRKRQLPDTPFRTAGAGQIEEPVMETIGTVTAIIKGLQAFFSRLRTQPSHTP